MKNKGITFIETIISLGILSIILAIIIPSLSSFRNQQSLKNTTDDIISLLNQARMQTLSSQNSNYYSVHFETGRAVLFTGGSFSEPNASNKQITFDSRVSIPNNGGLNLNGGVSDISFTRLTGDTNQYGTIIVRLVSDQSKQKTITINKTGIVSSN